MSSITNLFDWPNITLVDVFKDAESQQGNKLDLVEMELTDGRAFAIAVISGPHTEAVVQALRDAKES